MVEQRATVDTRPSSTSPSSQDRSSSKVRERARRKELVGRQPGQVWWREEEAEVPFLWWMAAGCSSGRRERTKD